MENSLNAKEVREEMNWRVAFLLHSSFCLLWRDPAVPEANPTSRGNANLPEIKLGLDGGPSGAQVARVARTLLQEDVSLAIC